MAGTDPEAGGQGHATAAQGEAGSPCDGGERAWVRIPARITNRRRGVISGPGTPVSSGLTGDGGGGAGTPVRPQETSRGAPGAGRRRAVLPLPPLSVAQRKSKPDPRAPLCLLSSLAGSPIQPPASPTLWPVLEESSPDAAGAFGTNAKPTRAHLEIPR